jgi:Na+-driven multidrug efflux pump
MQWVVFLPLAYLMGPVLGLGLTAIWLVQLGYRSIQTAIYVWLWNRRGWTSIKV